MNKYLGQFHDDPLDSLYLHRLYSPNMLGLGGLPGMPETQYFGGIFRRRSGIDDRGVDFSGVDMRRHGGITHSPSG